jgi:inosine/xanthosine triphosphatase
MRISVGSKNPAKIAAVQNVFSAYESEIFSVDVPSGVREQPLSDDETITGAMNRAEAALGKSGSDIGIGLEGGVHQGAHGLFLCNWGVLHEKGLEPIIAGGARIALPHEISQRLLAGEELGPVMDEYAKKQNVRKKEGAIGIFTNGRVDRAAMFSHIMSLLLGQFEYRMAQNNNEEFTKIR